MIMTFCLIFLLKKNMKIELTVHLGTLLTHTVHRYAQFSLSYSYILGILKNKAFLYTEVCRQLKVTSPRPLQGQIFTSQVSVSSQPIRVHLGCSVQANHSRRGRSIQWLQQNGAPFGPRESFSHSCYGKCSLAVIPLVTGHGSPVSQLDRRRSGGWGGSPPVVSS